MSGVIDTLEVETSLTQGGTAVAKTGDAPTAHAASHSPTSLVDPLATAPPANQAPDSTAATGTSTSFARADHIHNIPTAAATTLDATSTNTQGAAATFTRADHTHALTTGAPSTQNATNTNTTGSSASLARADHLHTITTAAASTQTPDQTNATGTSASFARADHIHTIATAAASSLTTGSSSTKGSSTSFARADHTHAVTVTDSSVSAASGVTANSATDNLITGMTITPTSGRYKVLFISSCVNSGNGAQRTFVSIYFNGAQNTNSEVAIGVAGGAYGSVVAAALVSADGTHDIEARARVTAGTTTFAAMQLILIRLGN